MLLMPQPDTLFIDPFCKDVTLAMLCNIQDPLTKEDYTRDPRNVARKAVNYMKSTGVADAAMFGPSLEFFVFDDVKFDQTPHSAFYFVDSRRGAVEQRARREAEPRVQGAVQAGLLPVPAVGLAARPAQRDDARDDGVRDDRREPPPREGQRRAVRHQHAVRRPRRDGRQRAEVQVHREERGPPARQDRDVHAQAAVRGLRQRDARPRLPVEGQGGDGNLFAGSDYCGPVGHRDVRPRRAAPPRAGAVRDHQPHHEQLQAAGAGLRGAGEPGVQPAEPVGGHPHPGVLVAGEVEAAGVPRARRRGQPVPGVRRRC